MAKEKDQFSEHNRKTFIASAETVGFALAGLIYPPATLGCLVTLPEALRQESLAYKALVQNFQQLLTKFDKLEKKFKDHERSSDTSNDEPVPPNLETATDEEISIYKKTIYHQAFSQPENPKTIG
jgi:hypothetical protein